MTVSPNSCRALEEITATGVLERFASLQAKEKRLRLVEKQECEGYY